METTKHKLPIYTQTFFNNLSNYININLLYYGSIQRADYIPGYSDIDVLIFTENEYTTIAQMQSFLKVKKSQFKKFVNKIGGRLVYGYKIMYKDDEHNFAAEFSIYNEKFRKDALPEHNSKSRLNITATILLILLKILYYYFKLIGLDNYRYYKHFLLAYGANGSYIHNFLII